MNANISRAPWTNDQVANLKARQEWQGMHPYTCRDSSHGNLVPTCWGWVCLECDYTQDWAHGFDVERTLIGAFSA